MHLDEMGDSNRHKLGSSRRYMLFVSEVHENIRLEFKTEQIIEFVDMWKNGYTKEQICRKLLIQPIELALILMDLEYAGIIQPRAYEFASEATEQVRLEL